MIKIFSILCIFFSGAMASTFGNVMLSPAPAYGLLEVQPQASDLSDYGAPGETKRPFIVLHGVGDSCANKGMDQIVNNLEKLLPGHKGHCIEYGAGNDGWLTTIQDQVKLACKNISEIPGLKNNKFNIVGLSQGNMIARGIIEQCGDDVHNFVSLGGPHEGTASFPNCKQGGFWCGIINSFVHGSVYSDWVQGKLGPANYFKDPTRYSDYLKKCTWLPYVNNEAKVNATYKSEMANLNELVLVMFDADTVVDPKESAWFQFYQVGKGANTKKLVPLKESETYKKDLVGLKTLMDKDKVKFVSQPGQHLHIDVNLLEKTVAPALRN